MDDFFGGIRTGSDFSSDGLAEAVEENIRRILYGNLSRPEFEARALFEENLPDLPVGHLMDHRVRMPEDIALELAGDESKLGAFLERLLCASPHTEGRDMIAKALSIKPTVLRENLIELRDLDLDLFSSVVSGRLDQSFAAMSKRKLPAELIKLAQSCAGNMLILYCVFEIQLIAARAAKLNAGGPWLPSYHSPVLASDYPGGMSAITQAAQYRFCGLDYSPLPKGRPPIIASLTNEKFARDRLRATGRTEAEIAPEIESLLPLLQEKIGLAEKRLSKLKSASDTKEDPSKREHASTAIEGGIRAGVQLAFAALRLVNLLERKEALTDLSLAHRRLAFRSWRKAKLPAKRDSVAEVVLFVTRCAILMDAQAGQAFKPDGKQTQLEPQMDGFHAGGSVAGEDLFKTAKEDILYKQTDARPMASLNLDHELRKIQRFDILPDYRLGLTSLSSPTPTSTPQRTMGHEQPNRTKFKIIPRSRSNPVKPGYRR
ncbi:hypothetical protein [Sphingobium bisphenolivorans]|uniref:hypothetical protein n=1 Tax=Sphingobium bisphenolivorans TaxID=1335760 RepID=UPI0003A9D09D|nr:hypothetical protein [Sphingobium bisphenolivorans]